MGRVDTQAFPLNGRARGRQQRRLLQCEIRPTHRNIEEQEESDEAKDKLNKVATKEMSMLCKERATDEFCGAANGVRVFCYLELKPCKKNTRKCDCMH